MQQNTIIPNRRMLSALLKIPGFVVSVGLVQTISYFSN